MQIWCVVVCEEYNVRFILLLRFHVYIFVDVVKRGCAHLLFGEIRRYRNDRYYCYFVMLLFLFGNGNRNAELVPQCPDEQ